MKCKNMRTFNGYDYCGKCGSNTTCKPATSIFKQLSVVCAVGAAWGFLIAWGVGL